MGSDWGESLLSDVAEVIDSRHKTPEYSENGYPMVRVVDVNGGPLDLKRTKKVSDEVYEDFARGRDPEIGDLVISRVGSYGVVSYVNTHEKFCLGQNTAFIIPKINSRFLYYQLISPDLKWQIEQFVVGAVQKTISLKSIRQFKIKTPSSEEQKAIAHILGSLDDKIELNRQMNDTLESMAQALFKSWFVDFDPVIDNALAAGNPIPDVFAERAEQRKPHKSGGVSLNSSENTYQSLFPSEFEFTHSYGWIPKGWGVNRFKNIVEKYIDNRGKTPPLSEKGIPLIEVKHLPENSLKPDLNTKKHVSSETYDTWFRAHLEPDDIIISTVGTIGRICLVPEGDKFTIAQNLLGLRFNSEKASSYFIYYQMDSFRFRHDVDARLVTTVQASIKRKDLETIDLLAPPIELQIAFDNFVKPLVEKLNGDQNIQLAKLRDTLLPKLLSGELRIPDAENLIKEAGV